MNDIIVTYQEFKKLSKEAKANELNKYLAKMSRAELAVAWGVKKQDIHDWYFRLITEPQNKNRRGEEIVKVEEVEEVEEVRTLDVMFGTFKPKSKSFTLTLNGDKSGADIKEELLNIASILKDERVYQFTLSVEAE